MYVNRKLVPLAQELYQMANRCVSHGAPEDQSDIDMIPQELGRQFHDVNTYLDTKRNKSCFFFVDLNQPIERHGKFLKIMFKLTARSDNGKAVVFRLVRSKGNHIIKDSVVQVAGSEFKEYVTNLKFGHEPGFINPGRYDYFLQARYLTEVAVPIVKRFSLDCVYS